VRWHRAYDVEGSPLQLRLAVVQDLLRDALDTAPAHRPVQVLSLCAGRGTDVVGVLATQPRQADVRARLVELEPALAERAARDATAAGLDHVDVVVADASDSNAARGGVPADVLLACGIFGNVSAEDIRRFVEFTPALCAPGATVIWTRHRRPPDLTADVRSWFSDAGFEEVAFAAPDPTGIVGVGAHRLVTEPRPFVADHRLFTFVGDGLAR
jgi:hypothetical protein